MAETLESQESLGPVVGIPVRILVDLLDPLNQDPWAVGGVSSEQVYSALAQGRLRTDNPCWESDGWLNGGEADSEEHAERIAWLVEYGWDTSEIFQLEVDLYGGVCLNDGNHRLYALALFGCREAIVRVEVSGFLDIAVELLGVSIPCEVGIEDA